jgi:hypothetical protein
MNQSFGGNLSRSSPTSAEGPSVCDLGNFEIPEANVLLRLEHLENALTESPDEDVMYALLMNLKGVAATTPQYTEEAKSLFRLALKLDSTFISSIAAELLAGEAPLYSDIYIIRAEAAKRPLHDHFPYKLAIATIVEATFEDYSNSQAPRPHSADEGQLIELRRVIRGYDSVEQQSRLRSIKQLREFTRSQIKEIEEALTTLIAAIDDVSAEVRLAAFETFADLPSHCLDRSVLNLFDVRSVNLEDIEIATRTKLKIVTRQPDVYSSTGTPRPNESSKDLAGVFRANAPFTTFAYYFRKIPQDPLGSIGECLKCLPCMYQNLADKVTTCCDWAIREISGRGRRERAVLEFARSRVDELLQANLPPEHSLPRYNIKLSRLPDDVGGSANEFEIVLSESSVDKQAAALSRKIQITDNEFWNHVAQVSIIYHEARHLWQLACLLGRRSPETTNIALIKKELKLEERLQQLSPEMQHKISVYATCSAFNEADFCYRGERVRRHIYVSFVLELDAYLSGFEHTQTYFKQLRHDLKFEDIARLFYEERYKEYQQQSEIYFTRLTNDL